jgi:hypothetical protein
MKDSTDAIGLLENSKAYLSDIVPHIAFKNPTYRSIAENYLYTESKKVLDLLLGQEAKVEPLKYSDSFFAFEFYQIPIDKMYEILFSGLRRCDADGKLVPQIRWCATFDIDSTPNKLLEVQPTYKGFKDREKHSSEIRNFGTIEINGLPVLYIIHFKLEEILNFIKQNRSSEPMPTNVPTPKTLVPNSRKLWHPDQGKLL